MTDISTIIPTTIRRLSLPRLSFPRVAIGASLHALSRLIGNAFNMAYVEPYTGPRRRAHIIPEEGVDGRDPDW